MSACAYCDRGLQRPGTCPGCGAPTGVLREEPARGMSRTNACGAPVDPLGGYRIAPLRLDYTYERYHARLVL